MTVENTPPGRGAAVPRTVQEYIDETPMWADSTVVRYSPMTNMQWLIWGLAAAGKFFEGMVVFTTGVALPLMGREFALGATEKGVVAAASLFGILIGATALGGLADRYGRKEMFIIEMVLFAIFILVLTFSASFLVVVVALVGIGLALGCDYPTAHLIISESIPSRIRGRMVLAAFGFQAVGGLAGTAIGFLILYENPDVGAWRWMYASTILLAVPVIIGRFFVVQSRSGSPIAVGSKRPRWRPRGCCAVILHIRKRSSCAPRSGPQLPTHRRTSMRRGRRCSPAFICAGPFSPRCPGSCRTSAPTASESSRPLFWPP
jgi:MFS family permease